jgi:hypothetical protein
VRAIPDTGHAADFAAPDITPWSGETPDDVLAIGVREYSVAEAKAIVRRFAEVTTSCDVDAFVAGFTDDCVVSFNEHADITGHEALRTFMMPLFAGYGRPEVRFLCRKVLRSLTGNVFGVIWVNHWIDAKTRKAMRSKGLEYWIMRDGRIARWDAAVWAWRL